MPRLNRSRTVVLVVFATIAGLMIQDRGTILSPIRADEEAQEKAKAVDAREEDRAAIRSAMQSFTRAFESRDAKTLATHWTTEGEYQNDLGETIRGREALEKGFTAFFATTPEVTAEVHPEALRFLSRDSAIEEGSVAVRRGPTEAATNAFYSALFVREDGRWLLAFLAETPGGDPSIEDLEWLIGDWQSGSGQGAEIRTTYSWAPSKKFIHAQFTIKENELTLSGSQVIGVDPATGAIHTWTFEADGGVGEADWTPDGDHWILDAAGTLADGSTLVETNILRRVDDDTFTWQSIDRMLDDDALADLAPVKVTRIASEK